MCSNGVGICSFPSANVSFWNDEGTRQDVSIYPISAVIKDFLIESIWAPQMVKKYIDINKQCMLSQSDFITPMVF